MSTVPPPPTAHDPLPLAGRLTLGVGVALLVLALALGTVLRSQPAWSSSATLLIDQPFGLSVAQDSGLIEKLSRLRFKYAGLVGTEEFTDALPVAGASEGELTASVDPASLLLSVTAIADDEMGAIGLATAAGDGLVAYVLTTQTAAQVPPESQHVLQVVTPATSAAPLPSSTDRLSRGLLALGLPTLLAGGVLLVLARRRS